MREKSIFEYSNDINYDDMTSSVDISDIPRTIYCGRCQKYLTEDQFSEHQKHRGGYCKSCVADYNTLYKKNHPGDATKRAKEWRNSRIAQEGESFREESNATNNIRKKKRIEELFNAYCPDKLCHICKESIFINDKWDFDHVIPILSVKTEFGFSTKLHTVDDIDDAIIKLTQNGLEPANYFGGWALRSYLTRRMNQDKSVLTDIIKVAHRKCNNARNRADFNNVQ